MRILIAFAGAVLSLFSAAPADAFVILRTCAWNDANWSNDAPTRLNGFSFQPGDPWLADINNALGRWNATNTIWFDFSPVTFDPDTTFSFGDGVNEIFFSQAGAGGALAMATVRFNLCFFDQAIVEADVAFDETVGWEWGAHDPRTPEGATSFRFTAVHELGHFLGLDHEPNAMAALLTTASGFHAGTAHAAAPFGDDWQGARRLYPGFTETDVTASNFRLAGPDSTALILSEGVTSVRRGTTLRTGFAFGNLGTAFVEFPFTVYLSTNALISIADRPLISGGGWGTPGFFGDFTFDVVIPSDVAPGDYFIGVLLDPMNVIGESREANNRLTFPGTIRVTP